MNKIYLLIDISIFISITVYIYLYLYIKLLATLPMSKILDLSLLQLGISNDILCRKIGQYLFAQSKTEWWREDGSLHRVDYGQ